MMTFELKVSDAIFYKNVTLSRINGNLSQKIPMNSEKDNLLFLKMEIVSPTLMGIP